MREIYEQAKAAGKSASLLEQKRPNVFQMNVANILPGDTIKVELDYTELLVPEDGVYELVYPAVVGPRYSEARASGADARERHHLAAELGGREDGADEERTQAQCQRQGDDGRRVDPCEAVDEGLGGGAPLLRRLDHLQDPRQHRLAR